MVFANGSVGIKWPTIASSHVWTIPYYITAGFIMINFSRPVHLLPNLFSHADVQYPPYYQHRWTSMMLMLKGQRDIHHWPLFSTSFIDVHYLYLNKVSTSALKTVDTLVSLEGQTSIWEIRKTSTDNQRRLRGLLKRGPLSSSQFVWLC